MQELQRERKGERPAQRPAESEEDEQLLCNNRLADRNDTFVLNLVC